MVDTTDGGFVEQADYQVTRHDDGDVLVIFEGRMRLPEVASAFMEDDRLVVLAGARGYGIAFTGVDEEIHQWLRGAGTVFVSRVFNNTPHVTVLDLATPADMA